MIKRFGFKNFYSFKEGCEIDFTFDGKVPDDIKQGSDVGTVLGIKGANGSGKTNIIKAIGFLSWFWKMSSDRKTEAPIAYQPFYQSNETTELFIEGDVDGHSFKYEVELTRNEVIRESIFRKDKRETKILERNYNEITYATKNLQELEMIQLRQNASILSLLTKYKFKSDLSELHLVSKTLEFFLTNVDSFGMSDMGSKLDLSRISKIYLDDKELFTSVCDLLKTADNSIDKIMISNRMDEDGNEIYFPIFLRTHNGQQHKLIYQQESSGTKTLYKQLFLYFGALHTGGLLALDEFDIHIHSMILPKILNLFLDPEINKNHAQFIFTAHNTEILDTLGKYRTILVNKEDNESYCYRLDEIPGSMVRNDRSIIPLYMDGKIGGIPHV